VVTLTVEKGSVPAPERGTVALRNFGLRIVAAALHIFATAAVVQVLPPAVAGIYFKGVVIAYGLAALLRGKYELFIAQHFLGQPDPGIPARDLVRGLGIRVLIRTAIACAILLVITADLDVMEPHLRPYLETYLPFRACGAIRNARVISGKRVARRQSHTQQHTGRNLQYQPDDSDCRQRRVRI
jgi:hypothetical protein